MSNNPLAGAAWGALIVTAFLLSWQVFMWVVCLISIVVGSARLYHGRRGKLIRAWFSELRVPVPLADLLAGTPFLILLLAAWLLK